MVYAPLQSLLTIKSKKNYRFTLIYRLQVIASIHIGKFCFNLEIHNPLCMAIGFIRILMVPNGRHSPLKTKQAANDSTLSNRISKMTFLCYRAAIYYQNLIGIFNRSKTMGNCSFQHHVGTYDRSVHFPVVVGLYKIAVTDTLYIRNTSGAW